MVVVAPGKLAVVELAPVELNVELDLVELGVEQVLAVLVIP